MMVKSRKNLFFYCLMAALAFSFTACAQSNGGNTAEGTSSNEALNGRIDSISYFLGTSIGSNFKKQNLENINVDAYVAGLKDVMRDDSGKISQQAGQKMVRSYMREKKNEVASKNLKEAEAFLAKNKKKEGVKTTDSGLQYKVLKEGSGESPSKDDRVKANYEGRLPNGEVFDSSYDRGKPFTTPVGRVIPGWTEALQLMSVGSKYRIWVHPDLGYGKRGSRSIGPNQLLIFDLELLDVMEGKAPAKNKKMPGKRKRR